MTTTSHFQELPDFYKIKPVSPLPKPKNTNNRYPTFTQVHFTAGDIEQFETYRDPTNGENPTKVVELDKNSWNDIEVGEQIDYEKYSQLTTQSVMNTFLYLFEKFKKAWFTKLLDPILLPFYIKKNLNIAVPHVLPSKSQQQIIARKKENEDRLQRLSKKKPIQKTEKEKGF
jgi:hypothetical protein